jgi:hypothetical protein
MKIHPLGAELFHEGELTDERTDMTKLTVIFRNFLKAPKNALCLDSKVSLEAVILIQVSSLISAQTYKHILTETDLSFSWFRGFVSVLRN